LEALIRNAGLDASNASLPISDTKPTAPKKRFLLVGTHAHQTTGYSKVTYHIIQELSKLNQFELYHFGFQKFHSQPHDYRPYPPCVDVYDPAEAERNGAPHEMGFGYSQLPAYVQKVKPDVIMIYNDAGVVCRFLDKLAELPATDRLYKTLIYLDQVYVIQRPDLLARMEKDADAFFVFTDFWKNVLEQQGIRKPVYVMRHGFDPNQFKLLDKSAMRKKHNMPENVFLFLNLNRNTPRKRYDIVVQAFAELVARYPTKPLVLLAVCDAGQNGGYPIQEIYVRELERLRVPIQPHAHKLMITQSALNYTDELINELYAMSDVGITAADGEGFGLCQFEAMGVGIPQVVPNIGGFRDFCVGGKNSMTVNPKWRSYMATSHSSVGGIIEACDSHDLALAAEEYILDSELREAHGKAARETVLEYKWPMEVEKLAKVLQHL
jgi:glycosyltransferase involved in cell wall biosynthesis